MANDLNIRLKIDGVDTSIRSIRDLEAALAKSKEELKGLDIGSAAFTDLSQKIKGAEGQLKTLNREIEGLDVVQQQESFVKLGEGIVGAFTIGMTALQAFGLEAEDAQAAQLKITRLLTIAVGARQVAEGLLNLKIVANTIATRAQTLATNAATKATKGFYSVLAANPYTAILTAVSLLGAALFSLGEDTEDAGDKAKKSEDQWKDLEEQLKKNKAAADALAAQIEEEVNYTLPQQIKLRAALKTQIDNLTKSQDRIIKNIQDVNNLTREEAGLIAATDGYYQSLTGDLEVARKRYDALGASIKSQNTNSYNKALSAQKDRLSALSKELQNLINQFNELANVRGQAVPVVEELQKIIDTRQAFVDQNEEFLTDFQLFRRVFNVEIPEDVFGDLFLKWKDALEEAFLTGDVDTLQSAIEKVLFQASKAVSDMEITPQAYEAIYALTEKGYRPLLELLQTADLDKFSKQFENVFSPDAMGFVSSGVQEITRVVDEMLRLKGVIEETIGTRFSPPPLVLIDFVDTEGLEGEALRIAKFFNDTAQGLVDGVDAATKESYEKYIKLQNDLTQSIFEQIKASGKYADATNEQILEIAANTVQGILDGYKELRTNSNEIFKIVDDTLKKTTIIEGTRAKAITGFFLQYVDRIKGLETGLTQERLKELTQYVGNEKKFTEEVVKDKETLLNGFNNYLRKIGATEEDITQMTEEAKLEIIKRYLALQVGEVANAEASKRSELETTLNKIDKYMQEITNVLSNQFALLSENIRYQQEKFAMEEEALLEKVVGDTKYAADKRIQIQEEYEKKQKELQKKARLLELRSSQAQAITNSAQAITGILRTWASNPVIAGILIGITTAQTLASLAIIQKQISTVQSFALGGLLNGKSHANGGMMLSPSINAEGGETIINRQSSLMYRGLLNSISTSQGTGRQIVYSPYDDTALIEALNKNNTTTPIRAYVVERDITSKQEVNARLNQLSRF